MPQDQIVPPDSMPTSHSIYQPKIISNPDGTYTRLIPFPSIQATPDPTIASPVLTKDIHIKPTNKTWLRIFLPRQALDSSSGNKLPLIVYYHGGGFVFVSAASTEVHDFCTKMATELTAIVVSVEYRLAPEHRLPAAYDDAIDALHCIKTSQEVWLSQFADLSTCFLMGTSAGGNIVYHAGLRACEEAQNLEPLKIKGLILHHAFFGGSERTKSELKVANDPVFSQSGLDLMWELALPVGADRDHEYCKPMVGYGSKTCELIRTRGWRVLVTVCYGDPLVDRQIEFTKMLMGKGVDTVAHFGEGYHSMELRDPSTAEALFSVLKEFMSQ